MSVYSPKTRLSIVENYVKQRNELIPIGVRFRIYERGKDDKPKPTDIVSKIYGGMFSKKTATYVEDLKPTIFTEYPCHEEQFNFVIDESTFSYALGGRGGGKSEAAKLRVMRLIAEYAGFDGIIAGPTFDIGRNIFYSKILAAIPQEWIVSVNRSDKEIELITGTILRLRTAKKVDGLRSFGGAFGLFDEDQDCSDEAHEILLPTLREVENPKLFCSATPKRGMFEDRIEAAKLHHDTKIFTFPSLNNPFISQEVFKRAKETMDPRRYRQEILAEFVSQDSLVYHSFDRDEHMRDLDRFLINADITRSVSSRFDSNSKWLIGMDYNAAPMSAIICKILRSANNDQLLYAHTEVLINEDADPWKMASKLKKLGFGGSLIFDDASGERSEGGRSASAVMRGAGFKVIHRKSNPAIIDRVNAVRARLKTADGRVHFFANPKRCKSLRVCFESQVIDHNGKPDKTAGFDHLLDALGYLVYQVWPPHLFNKEWKKVA